MDGLKSRLHLSYVVWLTFMWVLLMGELTLANVVAGLLLALAIVLFLPLPQIPRSHSRVAWGKLIVFVLRWFGDLLTASAKVAWLALRPAAPPRNAVLQVPMRVSNDLVLYLATCAYNLQPGGSVTDLDVANRTWTIHVLDADGPEDIERERENVAKLERDMIDIFESRGSAR
ncbi:Na+/H+ antiporter subunit E [Corynebacterium liangguodongii]|uniref:Na+/H+ antiporter subunit E n=1 Tax=Corynebacterium liangguodongii TaxID=2079535 RepID=A0A2S0WG28_9CORY|nr:Na+/H+ antiporter subunit E [Corynebacterium liangguodongii]AWB84686.1 Na+/H+ antiporter subunit E [Corynebacterium liangguodongii]PWB99694.1 Na+/H+ antiporter subunit E [Corynebacterium liangguodongii]